MGRSEKVHAHGSRRRSHVRGTSCRKEGKYNGNPMLEGPSIVIKAYDVALWLFSRGRNGVRLLDLARHWFDDL